MDKDFTKQDWYDFIKEVLRMISIKDQVKNFLTFQTCVFLISESQIVNESFLEDINNLLNIGEIPNLFQNDEKENLVDDIKEQT